MKKNLILKQLEAMVFTVGLITLADKAYEYAKAHINGKEEEKGTDLYDLIEKEEDEEPARGSCYDTCIWREEDGKGGCFCTRNEYNALKESMHGFCGKEEDSLDESAGDETQENYMDVTETDARWKEEDLIKDIFDKM